jgi:hypothetical protein
VCNEKSKFFCVSFSLLVHHFFLYKFIDKTFSTSFFYSLEKKNSSNIEEAQNVVLRGEEEEGCRCG